MNQIPSLIASPDGGLLVAPTTKNNLVHIRPVRSFLVQVVRCKSKVDVMAGHHWGKVRWVYKNLVDTLPSKKTCW